MTKHARSVSWKDVKTVLAQHSAPELLQLSGRRPQHHVVTFGL